MESDEWCRWCRCGCWCHGGVSRCCCCCCCWCCDWKEKSSWKSIFDSIILQPVEERRPHLLLLLLLLPLLLLLVLGLDLERRRRRLPEQRVAHTGGVVCLRTEIKGSITGLWFDLVCMCQWRFVDVYRFDDDRERHRFPTRSTGSNTDVRCFVFESHFYIELDFGGSEQR